MPKTIRPTPDAENPEWTKEKFARAKRLEELPAAIQTALGRRRGSQKTPTKKLVSIRLSPDVLAAVRATGDGWQRRIDEALRSQFLRGSMAGAGRKSRDKVA